MSKSYDLPSGRRQKDEPRLIGAKEASAICGVSQSNLRTQAGLPEPYDVVAATTLWRHDEIKAYARRRASQRRREAVAA